MTSCRLDKHNVSGYQNGLYSQSKPDDKNRNIPILYTNKTCIGIPEYPFFSWTSGEELGTIGSEIKVISSFDNVNNIYGIECIHPDGQTIEQCCADDNDVLSIGSCTGNTCKFECIDTSMWAYDPTSNTCKKNATGTYNSQSSCEAANVKYDCSGYKCVTSSTANQYTNEAACQKECTTKASLHQSDKGCTCVADAASGKYKNMINCQQALHKDCIPTCSSLMTRAKQAPDAGRLFLQKEHSEPPECKGGIHQWYVCAKNSGLSCDHLATTIFNPFTDAAAHGPCWKNGNKNYTLCQCSEGADPFDKNCYAPK